MRRGYLVGLAGLLIALAAGCEGIELDLTLNGPPYPVGEWRERINDPALLGIWTAIDPNSDVTTLSIRRSARSYKVELVADDGETMQFGDSFAVQLDSVRFLNLALEPPHSGYVHLRYESYPPGMLTILVLEGEEGIEITTAKEFTAFIQANLDRTELYADPLVFRREQL